MSNHKETIAEIRKTVPGKDNGLNIRSNGPPELRNKSQYPDEAIENEVQRVEKSIVNEFPDRDISFDQNEEAQQARKYFSFIRANFLDNPEHGPQSISHARRFRYDDEQLRYWRDQMIRALGGI